MYVYWLANFHTFVDSPKDSGGDAYSYYYAGVWDETANEFASSDCHNKTHYQVHASDDHEYSSDHHVADHCSFTAKPGHHYFVYFNVKADIDPVETGYEVYATSELDTVDYVHIQYFEGVK